MRFAISKTGIGLACAKLSGGPPAHVARFVRMTRAARRDRERAGWGRRRPDRTARHTCARRAEWPTCTLRSASCRNEELALMISGSRRE